LNASPEPTGDAELERLLDAYNDAAIAYGQTRHTGGFRAGHAMDEARAALLAHIAAHYRRLDPDEIVMRHVNLGPRPPIRFEEGDDDADHA
jgi:hypothetical protein